MMPWTVRNATAVGGFVPTTTRLGVTLYDSFGRQATGGSDMRFEAELSEAMNRLDERRYNEAYRRLAFETIGADPGRAVPLAAAKLGRLWSPVPNASFAQAAHYRWASLVAFVPMAAAGLLGSIVLALRRPRALAVLLAPVVWVTMVHSVIVGSVRYRVPVEPLVWVAAAAAVAWVFRGEAVTDD